MTRSVFTNVVCPFCPLHCDDVTVDTGGNVAVDCDRASDGFRFALATDGESHARARIGHDLVDREKLVEQARSWANAGGAVIVFTTAADLQTSRHLERLRSAGKLVCMSDSTPTQAAIRSSANRDGSITATWGAVARYADLIWVIGRPQLSMPRWLERLRDRKQQVGLIEWPNADAETLADLAVIEMNDDTNGHDSPSVEWSARCRELHYAVQASRYVGVLVGDQAFDPATAFASAAMLNRIVRHWNGSRRAAIVHFDPSWTMRAVTAWTRNESLADYDSVVHPGDELADRHFVIRLGDPPSHTKRRATVQLGGTDPGVELANAYAPAAMVGVHRAGSVIRGDGTVTLPLALLSESKWPPVTAWLTAIFNEVET